MARIGIFCTASADPLDSAAYYLDMFIRVYGAANATYIPVTENSNNADDPDIADLVLLYNLEKKQHTIYKGLFNPLVL